MTKLNAKPNKDFSEYKPKQKPNRLWNLITETSLLLNSWYTKPINLNPLFGYNLALKQRLHNIFLRDTR